MKYLLILSLFFGLTISLNAQIKAITQTGKTVVLYDDGTWKYESGPTAKSNTLITEPASTAVTINEEIVASSGSIQIFDDVSKKLARFFGEEKGKIKCLAKCTNNKGKVSLSFELLVPVGDANRYFGYSLQDRNITIQLEDGTSITTIISENATQKFIDKYNVSYFEGTCILTKEQSLQLLKTPAVQMSIDWKKTEETYQLTNRSVMRELMSEVF